ncbi:MAG: hypothetical protein E7K72_00845 [Roseomonas mucosa]|nr:hypothetical protein [Roseomonas mucosa]
MRVLPFLLLVGAGVLAQGVAMLLGGVLLFDAAPGRPGAVAGALLLVTPAALVMGGVVVHHRLRRRGSRRAWLAVAAPLAGLLLILATGIVAMLGFG